VSVTVSVMSCVPTVSVDAAAWVLPSEPHNLLSASPPLSASEP
jgi:hypothetical protein